jgi:predicted glutamine amidotransferase
MTAFLPDKLFHQLISSLKIETNRPQDGPGAAMANSGSPTTWKNKGPAWSEAFQQ